MLRIILPTEKYFSSYLEACREFQQRDILVFPLLDLEHVNQKKIFQSFENYRLGKKLPKGFVPSTTYWFMDGEEFAGIGNLRHLLTDSLECYGGHIGYSLLPAYWNQGRGTAFLGMLLAEAARHGIKSALLTCHDDNIPSARVMEKNGGVFMDIITNKVEGRPVRTKRYLIGTGLPIKKSLAPDFFFKSLPRLYGYGLELAVEGYCRGDVQGLPPSYIFQIYQKGTDKRIGTADLRIGHTEESYYGGQIGYSIQEDYQGHHYAQKACLMMKPIAQSHGLTQLEITCNPENTASRRTMERLGAQYLELVKLPEHSQFYKTGDRFKRRYVWKF